ncbi:hypothetical protein Tco_1160483 [Tanacetum coccineum]
MKIWRGRSGLVMVLRRLKGIGERLLVVVREVEAECDAVEVKMQEALETHIVADEECAGLPERFAVQTLLLDT